MVIIIGLLLVLLSAALGAVPLTFFSMLFLGNIGHPLSFLDLLPGAMAVNIALGGIVPVKKG